jgi:hypothetical protein
MNDILLITILGAVVILMLAVMLEISTRKHSKAIKLLKASINEAAYPNTELYEEIERFVG